MLGRGSRPPPSEASKDKGRYPYSDQESEREMEQPNPMANMATSMPLASRRLARSARVAGKDPVGRDESDVTISSAPVGGGGPSVAAGGACVAQGGRAERGRSRLPSRSQAP